MFDVTRQHQCNYRINQSYTYFVGAVAALSDFYFAIIPITMLVPLRLDMKLKWGLSFLMGCGVFAGVAAIVRSWAAKFITSADPPCKDHPSSNALGRRQQLTANADGDGILFLWGEIEEWVVLIAMSIPPIWPLFRPLFQRVIKTTTSQSWSRRYKQDYGAQSSALASPTAGTFPPPRITTTISISSNKEALPSPGHNAQFTKFGAIDEQPIDSDSQSESATAVSRTEGEEDPRRTSLPVVDNVRNSRKFQGGWLELKDLKEQGHKP